MSYGCYSRKPFKTSYDMHGISKVTGEKVSIVIPFRNSPDCNYTSTALGQADFGCMGCKHKSTPPYADIPTAQPGGKQAGISPAVRTSLRIGTK
jgi:hypothetical protein